MPRRADTTRRGSNQRQDANRFGVIDIGSNSVRLLLVERIKFAGNHTASPSWRVLHEAREVTRLASGLAKNSDKVETQPRTLSREAMESSALAIARFVEQAQEHGIAQSSLRAFATAAMREAANSDAFATLVRERAEIDVKVISGREEAMFAFRGASRSVDLANGRCAVIDIGGGSTEVVLSKQGVVTGSATMPLGAVRLTEQFGGAEQAAGEQWKDLQKYCDDAVRAATKKILADGDVISIAVGCGGTFGAISMLKSPLTPPTKQGKPCEVSRDQIRTLLDQLRSKTLAQRQRSAGLPPDRADIIVAGLTIAERLMKQLQVDRLSTCAAGVREGMMLQLIAESSDKGDVSRELAKARLQDASSLASRCNAEPKHGNHVAMLSLAIFDALQREEIAPRAAAGNSSNKQQWGRHPHERAILESAGLLHDAGIMVEYRRHHKHSESIVRHADLRNWSGRDREILAQVCRYHRRSEPSDRHKAFKELNAEDHATVQRLAAVLRVADSLDRSHRQIVRSVELRRDKDVLWIKAMTTAHAHDERRAVAKKGTLLEQVLGMSLRLTCELIGGEIVIAPGAKLSTHADATHLKRTDASSGRR